MDVLCNLPIRITVGGPTAEAFAKVCADKGFESVSIDPDPDEAPLRKWLLEQRRMAHPGVRVVADNRSHPLLGRVAP